MKQCIRYKDKNSNIMQTHIVLICLLVSSALCYRMPNEPLKVENPLGEATQRWDFPTPNGETDFCEEESSMPLVDDGGTQTYAHLYKLWRLQPVTGAAGSLPKFFWL